MLTKVHASIRLKPRYPTINLSLGNHLSLIKMCGSLTRKLRSFLDKLHCHWNGSCIVTQVFPHGAIEIHDPPNGGTFKVNGQCLKQGSSYCPISSVQDIPYHNSTIPMHNTEVYRYYYIKPYRVSKPQVDGIDKVSDTEMINHGLKPYVEGINKKKMTPSTWWIQYMRNNKLHEIWLKILNSMLYERQRSFASQFLCVQ